MLVERERVRRNEKRMRERDDSEVEAVQDKKQTHFSSEVLTLPALSLSHTHTEKTFATSYFTSVDCSSQIFTTWGPQSFSDRKTDVRSKQEIFTSQQ